MQIQRINITLPFDLARDLRMNIPQRSRSKFIAQAIKDKLPKKDLKLELKRSLKENYRVYQNIAGDWVDTEIERWPQ